MTDRYTSLYELRPREVIIIISLHMMCTIIIVDYIDVVFGGKSLWPTDPYQKAVQQLLVNDFGNKVRTLKLQSFSCTLTSE